MATPCISDIDAAITNLEFLLADLIDLRDNYYTSECGFTSLDRVNDSKCRTIGVAGQIVLNMAVDIAAYPISAFTSTYFPPEACA